MMFKNHLLWLVSKIIKCNFWWCHTYLALFTTNVENDLHYIKGKVALVDWCWLIFGLFQVECCGMFPPQSCTHLAYFLAVASGFLACSTPQNQTFRRFRSGLQLSQVTGALREIKRPWILACNIAIFAVLQWGVAQSCWNYYCFFVALYLIQRKT